MKRIRHLLSVADVGPEKFWRLAETALELKAHPTRYIRALYEKTLLMIFEAPSLRTRLSFETAMTQLHGHAINYYTIHSPWGLGKESIQDVARTVSRYCDAVTARIFSHNELKELAKESSVPVINAMTNNGHPCQILGDFMTIREKLGKIRGLRLAYCGDARNNVTYSLMRAAALTGNTLVVGCPDKSEYRPEDHVMREVQRLTEKYGGTVEIVHDSLEAVDGADIVYTDSWMSTGSRRNRRSVAWKNSQTIGSTGAFSRGPGKTRVSCTVCQHCGAKKLPRKSSTENALLSSIRQRTACMFRKRSCLS
jgi:ornithine carbamoyltransferase